MGKKQVLKILSMVFFTLTFLFSIINIIDLDELHLSFVNSSFTEAEIEPLQGDGEIGQPQQTPQTPQKPSRPAYRIVINLDEHKLYLFKNEEIFKTYPVSGGKTSTPSPVGTWRIIGKDTWGEGFGGRWMAINVPWGKYGIHGTIYPWAIGNNVSKGCIRMLNKDVKELYNMVPVGTTVIIIHDNPTFRPLRNGHFGSDVLTVQKMLKELGYYKMNPDGRYGSYLTQIVRNFQKDNKLSQTGSVNKTTYDRIKAAYNAKRESENPPPAAPAMVPLRP